MKRIFLLLTLSGFLLTATASSIGNNIGNTSEPTSVPDKAVMHNALTEFMNLTRHERKMRIKEAKAEIKNYKAAKKAGDAVSTNQVLLIILAILLPPLAVYLHEGEINNKFWIDLLLTLLLFLPGIIYALYIILSK